MVNYYNGFYMCYGFLKWFCVFFCWRASGHMFCSFSIASPFTEGPAATDLKFLFDQGRVFSFRFLFFGTQSPLEIFCCSFICKLIHTTIAAAQMCLLKK